MARVFTINFPYKDNTYTAVITQLDGSINIYIPDEKLHTLLPQGRISFDPAQGIPIDAPQLKPAQDLIVTVLGAIESKNREVAVEKKEQT